MTPALVRLCALCRRLPAASLVPCCNYNQKQTSAVIWGYSIIIVTVQVLGGIKDSVAIYYKVSLASLTSSVCSTGGADVFSCGPQDLQGLKNKEWGAHFVCPRTCV